MRTALVKATVLVRLKPEVLDPQGDAVRRALTVLGFDNIRDVRIGKLVEIDIEGASDPASLKDKLGKMSDELLANPVIEDYEIRIG